MAIGDIRYDEYILDDDPSSDLLGTQRTELQIWVLEKEADITGLFTDYTKSVNSFDVVSIHFYFEPKRGKTQVATNEDPSDFYGELDTEYEFDMNLIEGHDEITKSLSVIGSSMTDKLKVHVALSDAKLEDGTLETSHFQNLTHIEFQNCMFPEGISIQDRTRFILTLDNCEIASEFDVKETRAPNALSNINVQVTGCQFKHINGFVCYNLNMVSLQNCIFENIAKTPEYFQQKIDNDEEILPSDYISPLFKIDTCKYVDIGNIKIINILTAFTLNTIKKLTLNNFQCKHVYIEKPIRVTTLITKCDDVTVFNYFTAGLLVDETKKVSITSVKITEFNCKRADFGIQVTRISEASSVSNVHIQPRTVLTGVIANVTDGTFVVSNSTFEELVRGVSIMGINNRAIITDCNFIKCLDCGCTIKSATELSTIMDSVFQENKKSIDCQQGSEVDIINVDLKGKSNDDEYPSIDFNDILFQSMESVRLIGSRFTGSSIGIDTSSELYVSDMVITDSYFSCYNSKNMTFLKSFFNLGGVSAIQDRTPFEITNGNKINVSVCEFKDVMPTLTFVDNPEIVSSVFHQGLHIVGSMGEFAHITDNTFGDAQNPKIFNIGLKLSGCMGIIISKNVFEVPSKMTAINLENSQYCIIDYLNEFKNPEIFIDAQSYESTLNGNHIMVNTTLDTSKRPKIKSESVFREALFVFNKKKFEELGYTKSNAQNVYELFGFGVNIVSFLNPTESWVPSFIASIQTELKGMIAQVP